MHRLLAALVLLFIPSQAAARPNGAPIREAIAGYVHPYVKTNNFSGAVLAVRGHQTLFEKAYGYSDREARVPNTLRTRFHVASMSMQFTAAAALRLVQAGKIKLDTPVADVLPDYPNGQSITIRHLLMQTSGIADINAQDDYDQILAQHQTPLSLVNRMRGVPALRRPGTYDREEHSAYNLLALIIERKAGAPFRQAVKELVFDPLDMRDSGIDDDSADALENAAKGYHPSGLYDLAPERPIHWSAKAGNASAYTTVGDELKFVRGLMSDAFLAPDLRRTVFDLGSRVGFGWFKSHSDRFGQPVYSMNGRSPGFASAVIYVPGERLFVAAFSNVYASVPADMTVDVAALALGKPYAPLRLQTKVDSRSLAGLPASFQFPADFYQPNAVVTLTTANGEVSLKWPSLASSPLIPIAPDRYVDRAYWVTVEVQRGPSGAISGLKYDRFAGAPIPA